MILLRSQGFSKWYTVFWFGKINIEVQFKLHENLPAKHKPIEKQSDQISSPIHYQMRLLVKVIQFGTTCGTEPV